MHAPNVLTVVCLLVACVFASVGVNALVNRRQDLVIADKLDGFGLNGSSAGLRDRAANAAKVAEATFLLGAVFLCIAAILYINDGA